MSLHSIPRGALGNPGREEYSLQFCRHCHFLIAVGYKRIHAEQHAASDEDFITARLVEEVKAAQRAGSLPAWTDRYFITDQTPVSMAGRSGKKRPKIDIEIESGECRDRPTFHFEAKRLRQDDSHSVSEYLGTAGLGSFTSELYARTAAEGGMLGYVQSASPRHWAEAIKRKLDRTPKKYGSTDDGPWTASRLIDDSEHTYATRHSRPTLGKITIHHTLLDFREEEDEG